MTATTIPSPMVLAPLGGSIPFGNMTTSLGSALTFQFNAAGDKVAIYFIAPSTDVPNLISFYIHAVTTAGTAGTIDATLETVTDGVPSGTLVTNSNTGTGTFSTTGAKTISGIAGTATVTAGTAYYLVLTAGSGWDRDLTIRLSIGSSNGTGVPNVKTKDVAGGWNNAGGTNSGWCFGYANSGGTYIQVPGLMGAHECALQSFGSGTNPDERGNRFVLPVPMTCIGAVATYSGGAPPGANDDVKIKLLSSHTSSPVEERTVTVEGEAQASYMSKIFYFASGFACAANTTYAITMEAIGTDTQSMPRHDWPANADLAGILGASFYATTRNDLGNCTDDDNSMYAIFPLFSKMDDGAGGGGSGGYVIGG